MKKKLSETFKRRSVLGVLAAPLHRHKEDGFSLIELGIALGIIAFFALVVSLAAEAYLKKSRVTSSVETLQNIQTAVTTYYSQNSKHPCKTTCNSTNGWTDLTGAGLANDPDSNWSVACTNGSNFDIVYTAGDLVSEVDAKWQNKCATTVTDATAKTVTCRMSTSAYCP